MIAEEAEQPVIELAEVVEVLAQLPGGPVRGS